MNWGEVIVNTLGVASGGGILGIFGAYFKGKQELRKLEVMGELEEKRAKIRIEELQLQIDKGTIEGQLKSFTASQEAGREDGQSLDSYAKLSRGGVSNFVILCGESLRRATRPALTWGLLASYLYALASFPELRPQIIPTLPALAGTAVGWWFGSRNVLTFNDLKTK